MNINIFYKNQALIAKYVERTNIWAVNANLFTRIRIMTTTFQTNK